MFFIVFCCFILNFWYVSGILLVGAWGQTKKCRNMFLPLGLSSGVTGGCPACRPQTGYLLGQWLYGFLMQKKRILHLHFCQGSFAAADPAFCSVTFQQPHLTAGLWWYFEKQHKASELLQELRQEKNCFVLGKKNLLNTAISQFRLLIALDDTVARICISDVTCTF